jgi:hypothetical protein
VKVWITCQDLCATWVSHARVCKAVQQIVVW